MNDLTVLIIAVPLTATVVISILRWRLDRRRREGLAVAAALRGWVFQPEHDRTLASTFRFLDALPGGSNRYATDVLSGQHQGLAVLAFNHHTETTKPFRDRGDAGGGVDHHWHGVVAVRLPGEPRYPQVVVGRRGILDWLTGQFVGPGVDFSHTPAFANAYRVASPHPALAHQVCNTSMVDLLLRTEVTFELEGPWLATVEERRLTADHLDRRMAVLTEILRRLPPTVTAS